MADGAKKQVMVEDTAEIKFLEVNLAEAAVAPGSSFYVRDSDGVLIRVVAPTYEAPVEPSPIITVQYFLPSLKKKSAKATSRKKRRVREPGAPKKARNAYMLFCSQMRGHVKEEDPTLPFAKIGKREGSGEYEIEVFPYTVKPNVGTPFLG